MVPFYSYFYWVGAADAFPFKYTFQCCIYSYYLLFIRYKPDSFPVYVIFM